MQSCLNVFNSPDTVTDEYDAVGKNVAAKLRRMEFSQKVLAESLINQVIIKGVFGDLTKTTYLEERQPFIYNSCSTQSSSSGYEAYNYTNISAASPSYTNIPAASPISNMPATKPDSAPSTYSSMTQCFEDIGNAVRDNPM